jgi:hypothetical protein
VIAKSYGESAADGRHDSANASNSIAPWPSKIAWSAHSPKAARNRIEKPAA